MKFFFMKLLIVIAIYSLLIIIMSALLPNFTDNSRIVAGIFAVFSIILAESIMKKIRLKYGE